MKTLNWGVLIFLALPYFVNYYNTQGSIETVFLSPTPGNGIKKMYRKREKGVKMIRDRLKEFRDAAGLGEEMITITAEGGEDQRLLLELLDKIGRLYAKIKEMQINVTSMRSLIYEHDSKSKLEDGFSNLKSDARKLKAALDDVSLILIHYCSYMVSLI
ncbi:hypothetical protein SK128_017678 [Halocaridina rubra]|uniref:Uncharacterized protein n=1 Tax=Halocaridina rubra TaxID=373956 RepID=A0AAN8WVC4_HALRR